MKIFDHIANQIEGTMLIAEHRRINAKLKADRKLLLEALKKYRGRDQCQCATCRNADAAIAQTEKEDTGETHQTR